MLTAEERRVLEYYPVFTYIRPEAIDSIESYEQIPPLVTLSMEHSYGKVLQEAEDFRPVLASYIADIESRLPEKVAGFPTSSLKEAYVRRALGIASLADLELLQEFDRKVPPSEERLLLTGYALLSREAKSLASLVGRIKSIGSVATGLSNPTPEDFLRAEADKLSSYLETSARQQAIIIEGQEGEGTNLEGLINTINLDLQMQIDIVSGFEISLDGIRGFAEFIYNKLIEAGLRMMEEAAHDILHSLASGVTRDFDKWREAIAKAKEFLNVSSQALTVYTGILEWQGGQHDSILTGLYNRLLDEGETILLEKLHDLVSRAVEHLEERIKPDGDEDLNEGMGNFLQMMTDVVEQIVERLRNLIKEEYKKLRMEVVGKRSEATAFGKAVDMVRIRDFLGKFSEALTRLEEILSKVEDTIKDPAYVVNDWLAETLKLNNWPLPWQTPAENSGSTRLGSGRYQLV